MQPLLCACWCRIVFFCGCAQLIACSLGHKATPGVDLSYTALCTDLCSWASHGHEAVCQGELRQHDDSWYLSGGCGACYAVKTPRLFPDAASRQQIQNQLHGVVHHTGHAYCLCAPVGDTPGPQFRIMYIHTHWILECVLQPICADMMLPRCRDASRILIQHGL